MNNELDYELKKKLVDDLLDRAAKIDNKDTHIISFDAMLINKKVECCIANKLNLYVSTELGNIAYIITHEPTSATAYIRILFSDSILYDENYVNYKYKDYPAILLYYAVKEVANLLLIEDDKVLINNDFNNIVKLCESPTTIIHINDRLYLVYLEYKFKVNNLLDYLKEDARESINLYDYKWFNRIRSTDIRRQIIISNFLATIYIYDDNLYVIINDAEYEKDDDIIKTYPELYDIISHLHKLFNI